MPDPRIVSRREPIIVTVEGIKEPYEARPLPWRKRNAFGDTVSDHYVSALNDVLTDGKDADGNRTSLKMVESFIDYDELLKLAFPDDDVKHFEDLDFDGMIEILSAALEVNGLARLGYMIDPSKARPLPDQETTSAAAEGGQKIESSPDSSSPAED